MAQIRLTIILESSEGVSIYKSMGTCDTASMALNAELRRAWVEASERAAMLGAHPTMILACGLREVWIMTDTHTERSESIKFDRLIRALTRSVPAR